MCCGFLPSVHSDTTGKEVLYFCWFSTNLPLVTNLLTLISKVPSSQASSSPPVQLFSSRPLFCTFIFLFYFPLSVLYYLYSSFLNYFYVLPSVLVLFILSILFFFFLLSFALSSCFQFHTPFLTPYLFYLHPLYSLFPFPFRAVYFKPTDTSYKIILCTQQQMVSVYVGQSHRTADKSAMLISSSVYMFQCSIAKSSGLQY